MMTGTLLLRRLKTFNGLLSDVEVFIDNKRVSAISGAGEERIVIPAGRHIVKVQQLNKSGEQEIVIKENEALAYSFRPSRLSLVSFLNPILVVSFSYFFNLSLALTGLLLLPGVITSMYGITVGRKKYFVFIEQSKTD